MIRKNVLLFDVDGTLTNPMLPIDNSFYTFLKELKNKYIIALVGGSNIEKILYQMSKNSLIDFDYIFAENGLVAYHNGILIGQNSIREYLGENTIKNIETFVENYIDKLYLPIKCSKHIEIRHGLINISPIGRDCTYTEREEFNIYDMTHKIREKMIIDMSFVFPYLEYCVGGMISFDVYPKGWDKTFCLKYLKEFKNINFYGDKTNPGGNDYQIYIDKRVVGYSVKSWENTKSLLLNL